MCNSEMAKMSHVVLLLVLCVAVDPTDGTEKVSHTEPGGVSDVPSFLWPLYSSFFLFLLFFLAHHSFPAAENQPRAAATGNTEQKYDRGGATVKIPTGLLRLLVFFDSLLHGFPLLLESFT